MAPTNDRCATVSRCTPHVASDDAESSHLLLFTARDVAFAAASCNGKIEKACACVLAIYISSLLWHPRCVQSEHVENLVLNVLSSGGEGSIVEVQRQVCLSISFLRSSSNDRFLELVLDPFFEDISYRTLDLKFGPVINDRLLQLIREIFKTEASECWLGKLMDKELGHSFLMAACLAVACIASYACREVRGEDT